MKRFLTTGFLGTFLGIVIGGAPADASLISRSFLDQALTDYATTTALDLKADKSDFTALSNKIGTLPEGITLENFYKGWVDSGGESMAEYIAKKHGTFYTYDPVNDDVGPVKYPDVGYLDVLASLMDQDGFTPAENSVLAPFFYLTKQAMRVGEIPQGKTAAGMIDEINNKIGTLPTETAMSSCSVWRAIDLTQNEMPETIGGILEQLYSAGQVSGSCTHDGYNGPSLPNIIRRLIYGYTYNGGTAMMGINGLNVGSIDSTGNVIEPGLRQITNGWTDAKGGVIMNPGLKGMYGGWTDSGSNTYLGVMGLNDKIGTLPSGNFRAFPGYELLFPYLNQPLTYPTSLAELINAIYGNSETGGPGLLGAIIAGFQVDRDGDGQFDLYAGLLPNLDLATEAKELATTANATATAAKTAADSAVEKIGTLPTEYETVGAALTAIKGIAEEAKAVAVAAIPDPKTEGSTGKFVLTVDIVGDNATYRWEKIDREDETTTTTE